MPESMVWTNALVRLSTTTVGMTFGTTTTAEGSTGLYNVSEYVMRARLMREFDEHDDTTMGLTDHSRIPGLESWEVELEMTQTFHGAVPSWGAGNSPRSLDDLLYDLAASKVTFIAAIRTCNTARSCDNAEYWGPVRAFRHTPMDGTVGDLLRVNPVFRSAGNITRVTSATG